MAYFQGRRKSRYSAPAHVIFSRAKNSTGKQQICVYAECLYGGARVGPVWGHTDATIRRALATMTEQCPCQRLFHRARNYSGHRVVLKSDKAK